MRPLVVSGAIHAKAVSFEPEEPTIFEPGDTVLAFGDKLRQHLTKEGVVPKNRKLASLREKVWGDSPKFLFTYDPFLVNFEYDKLWQIQWDARLAQRFDTTGSLKPPIGKYKEVQDFTKVITWIENQYAKTGKRVPVSFDLETLGLDPFNPKAYIISVSVTVKPGMAHVVYFTGHGDQPPPGEKLWSQIQWLLMSHRISLRGANLKYDLLWVDIKWGIFACANFKFDTLLAGSLLDENRSNSLNTHAKIFTPIGGYDDELNQKYDKARMDLIPKQELIEYTGGDTDSCFQVADQFKKDLLKDAKLTRFYINLLHPASIAYKEIERRGVVVDVPYYKELQKETEAYIDAKHKELLKMLPRRVRIIHKHALSLTRAALLKDFLFSPKGMNLTPKEYTDKSGEPSTAKRHLLMFKDDPEAGEWIKGYEEWKVASKIHSTYIVGFLEHLRRDGRFHPVYFLHKGEYGKEDAGTIGGRASARDPAWQTIPKRNKIWTPKLRRAFIAPPGMVILSFDWSQGELRVCACVANEQHMIAAYKAGIDMHAKTGAEVFGISFEDFLKLPEAEQKKIRQGGKAGNFGLIYGMQALGFVDYAWNEYQVKLDLDGAEDFINTFFGMYPGLHTWHDRLKKFMKAHGYIRSPMGRIRHTPLVYSPDWKTKSRAERQGINSEVQSTLGDMAHLAVVELRRLYPKLWVFGNTHDNLAMYVNEDKVDLWTQRIKEVMEGLPFEKFGWNPQLNFPVDTEVGPNLSALKEMK